MLNVFGYCCTCGRLVAVKYLRTVIVKSEAQKDKMKVCKSCDVALQSPEGICDRSEAGSLSNI